MALLLLTSFLCLVSMDFCQSGTLIYICLLSSLLLLDQFVHFELLAWSSVCWLDIIIRILWLRVLAAAWVNGCLPSGWGQALCSSSGEGPTHRRLAWSD